MHKHGDVRADGKRFSHYRKQGSGFREEWLSPEAFERRRIRNVEGKRRRAAARRFGANNRHQLLVELVNKLEQAAVAIALHLLNPNEETTELLHNTCVESSELVKAARKTYDKA